MFTRCRVTRDVSDKMIRLGTVLMNSIIFRLLDDAIGMLIVILYKKRLDVIVSGIIDLNGNIIFG